MCGLLARATCPVHHAQCELNLDPASDRLKLRKVAAMSCDEAGLSERHCSIILRRCTNPLARGFVKCQERRRPKFVLILRRLCALIWEI